MNQPSTPNRSAGIVNQPSTLSGRDSPLGGRERELSKREREVMDILHELGGATAVQIRECLADPPTDSAVRSILRILVRKAHAQRTLDGRRYVYSPAMPLVLARRSALDRVLRSYFGGSVKMAVAALLDLDEGGLDPKARERIYEMIEVAEKEGR